MRSRGLEGQLGQNRRTPPPRRSSPRSRRRIGPRARQNAPSARRRPLLPGQAGTPVERGLAEETFRLLCYGWRESSSGRLLAECPEAGRRICPRDTSHCRSPTDKSENRRPFHRGPRRLLADRDLLDHPAAIIPDRTAARIAGASAGFRGQGQRRVVPAANDDMTAPMDPRQSRRLPVSQGTLAIGCSTSGRKRTILEAIARPSPGCRPPVGDRLRPRADGSAPGEATYAAHAADGFPPAAPQPSTRGRRLVVTRQRPRSVAPEMPRSLPTATKLESRRREPRGIRPRGR